MTSPISKAHRLIAIIPARAGSKRLPYKNKRMFHGKPLIAWTIEQAKACRSVDNILVTTDDDEVVDIAKQYDCLIRRRPDELCQDDSTSADVVLDATIHAPVAAMFSDFVLLQPTSPLRIPADIEVCSRLYQALTVGPSGAPNGAVYSGNILFFQSCPYFGGQSVYMPKERSVDIDTEDQFWIAHDLFEKYLPKG